MSDLPNSTENNWLRSHRKAIVVHSVVLIALLAAVGTGRIASTLHTRALVTDSHGERAAIAEEVGATLRDRFEAVQKQMLRVADQIADEDVVRRVLRIHQAGGPAGLSNPDHMDLIAWFDGLSLSRYTAAELYSADASLLAWNGFGMPLGDAALPNNADRLATGVVSDDAGRESLVLWLPVTDGEAVLGRIRIMRLAYVPVNVPSAFLRPYDLRDELTSQTDVIVQLEFGDSSVVEDGPLESDSRLRLEGLDGQSLGTAEISPPSSEDVVASAASRYKDVEVFWWSLVAFWVVFGIWRLYREWLYGNEKSSGNIRFREALLALLVLSATLIAFRYVLLGLDVPARWFLGSALFDPRYLASSIGGGMARSIGDLLLSTVFGFVLAVWIAEIAFRMTFPSLRGRNVGFLDARSTWLEQLEQSSWTRMVGATLAGLAGILCASIFLGTVVRQVIFDSTLDYFAWTGLSPEPLVLAVLSALVTATLTAALIIASIIRGYAWWIARFRDTASPAGHFVRLALPALAILVALFVLTPVGTLIPWWVCLLLWAFGLLIASLGTVLSGNLDRVLSVKVLLLIVLISSAIVYPLIYEGMMSQRQIRMEDVAEDFVLRKDAELQLVVEHVLNEAHDRLTNDDAGLKLPANYLQTVEIPLRDEYSLVLTLLDAEERPVFSGWYPSTGTTSALSRWEGAFGLLRQHISGRADAAATTGWVSQSTDGSQNTFGGLKAIETGTVKGWILATATPLTVHFARQDPDAVSAGLLGYGDWRSKLSVAEYRSGRLVQMEGSGFEKTRIPVNVAQTLESNSHAWLEESVFGTPYLTYYRLQQQEHNGDISPIVAVRTRSVIPYDHLYYLLRVTYAGLWVGFLGFVFGWVLRLRRFIQPRGESRFRDKVIDAFLVVGSVAVVLMGLIGQQVVQRENQGAVQSRLERRLERVANALGRYARPGEPLFNVFERVSIETLADELSLDLNVYSGSALTASSTTAEQEKLLIYSRLPIQAYRELYLQGYSKSFVSLQAEGDASYTMGYLALRDVNGLPGAVVAVLTIPEQERILEERARTTAYLYGALLLLLLVIMGTAIALANRLTRPISRLRDGLVTVAAGAFHRPIPVESNDEVGGLVRSFNEMQEQLAESRRKLAQHERELAWREMAKQVAHEIKNPLTPMKLSVQHLQRAFSESERESNASERFGALFRRITGTLITQIDTLAHIANEFYTFARMPKRHLELLDVNEIVRQAVNLFREEERVAIEVALWRTPLVVEGDREELQRVFINLIKNGIQAIPPENNGAVTIHVWPEGADGKPNRIVYCSINDTGTGIPEDLRDRIFQPNFSTKTSGMGLGLAIVQKTIEDMKGEIVFESWEGAGTTFTLKFRAAA